MQIEETRLGYLWQQYFHGRISAAERHELFTWMARGENEEGLAQKVAETFLQIEEGSLPILQTQPEDEAEAIFNAIISQGQAPVIPLKGTGLTGRKWWWIAAAAVIILAVGIGIITYTVISKRIEKSPATEVAKTNDVPAPKDTRAVIVLADGRKIYLDSAGNGTIANENGVNVVKNEKGEIIYSDHQITGSPGHPITYNTLNNPRGSKVATMTLNDGTKVWLNAGSSMTYPVAFVGKERKIEITGEAYFEVAHDAKKPFIVSKGDVNVQVLGTHFNVNAYDDEDALRVTLLEGSVQVSAKATASSASSAVKIKPGEQALINQVNPKISRIEVQTNADLDAVMAWKNGVFNYNGASLQMIMREVARWYDVEVVFEKNVNEQFYAEVTRNTNISTLLRMLETTKAVKFRVEGKKIIVTK